MKPVALLEALGVLVELDHVTRPVRGLQPPLRLADVGGDQARELAILRPELADLAELGANLLSDLGGFGVGRGDDQARSSYLSSACR